MSLKEEPPRCVWLSSFDDKQGTHWFCEWGKVDSCSRKCPHFVPARYDDSVRLIAALNNLLHDLVYMRDDLTRRIREIRKEYDAAMKHWRDRERLLKETGHPVVN